MAIYGTHSGMIISPDNSFRSVPWSYNAGLQADEAIINFRDLVVVSAGLVGGPVIGLIVGAIAGLERYFLGGFTAEACALSSFLSGIIAGQIQRINTKITLFLATITGTVSVLLQILLILTITPSFSNALDLVEQIIFPVFLITVGGQQFPLPPSNID
jgi:two-component system sensor histidine kinase LytS